MLVTALIFASFATRALYELIESFAGVGITITTVCVLSLFLSFALFLSSLFLSFPRSLLLSLTYTRAHTHTHPYTRHFISLTTFSTGILVAYSVDLLVFCDMGDPTHVSRYPPILEYSKVIIRW